MTAITITLDAATTAAVARRQAVHEPGGTHPGRSTAIRAALARYFALLTRAERGLRARLSDEEWALCMAALATTAWTPETIPHAWMTVADAITLDGLAEQYGVDGAALRAKLHNLPALDCAALVDAAERAMDDGERAE